MSDVGIVVDMTNRDVESVVLVPASVALPGREPGRYRPRAKAIAHDLGDAVADRRW
jgi:hypothetical protein